MELTGLLNYKECDIAAKLNNKLEEIITLYKTASTAADKLTYFGMAAAYVSEISWPDEGADSRNCDNNKRGCGKSCFKDIKKRWNDFVKEDGAGEFDANSSIGDICKVILSREKIREKEVKLDIKLIESAKQLKRRDSVERDLYLIACGANLIKSNPSYSSKAIDDWVSLVKNMYGVDLAKTHDIGYVVYNIALSANADTREMTV